MNEIEKLKQHKLEILVLLGIDIGPCENTDDLAEVIYNWVQSQGTRSELEDLMLDWQVMWIYENAVEVATKGWHGMDNWTHHDWLAELANYLPSLVDDDFITILKGLKGEVNVTSR